LVLLHPLLETDTTAAYRTPPAALAHLRPGERVVHGCTVELACDRGRLGTYPGPQVWWLQRRGWLELFPYAGVGHGVRYAYNTSPEGLDTVLVFAGNRALRDLGDEQALRLLAASAVDVVLFGREVEPAARDRVRLRARLPSLGGELWIYELRDRAEEVRLADRARGGDTRRVLLEILDSSFDPRRDAFIPGRSGPLTAGGGDAVVLSESWERLRIATTASGASTLVLGRAWLPHYRALVDGEPAATLVANMGQLAVEVPPGTHEVVLWVDRRPFLASLAGSLAGLAGLVGLALGGLRRAPPRLRLSDPGG
jgi:hypothetical protein